MTTGAVRMFGSASRHRRGGVARCLWGLALVAAGGCGEGPAANGDAGAACKKTRPASITASIRWQVPMKGAEEGSPSICDLDHDGKPEALVPIAVPDHPEASYLFALDAATGAIRWQTAPGTASYANPYCVDLDRDGVDDVVAGGRVGDVVAVSGVDGRRLWSVGDQTPGLLDGNTHSTVAPSPDSDVMFFSAGGNGGTFGNRVIPGRLVALGRDGKPIDVWHEPDGREMYSSPAVLRLPSGEVLVAVGSGGELLPGSLHLVVFDPVKGKFAWRGSIPSGCDSGGFVASPMFGDLDGDGTPEVVDVDYCGGVYAIGLDARLRWSYKATQLYATGNPLLADLRGSGGLDVVAVFESINPSIMAQVTPATEVVAINGTTGALLWAHHDDRLGYTSAVSADYDQDCVEDAWVWLMPGLGAATTQRLILSGVDGQVLAREDAVGGMSGTAVLGDFDGNGDLDVLATNLPVGDDPLRAGAVVRTEYNIPFVEAASWSGFRGYRVHDGHRK